ncbi:hypothetical protein IFM89_017099 [Coptis chinensis]|uniref:Uncharacterized protein n=1 Tax=Coptis chinensis TaxID=261450 RepID=A0A835MCX0_9MAGN|nr:hypothetical protein IFM89_017099 [Coptis chinensis]
MPLVFYHPLCHPTKVHLLFQFLLLLECPFLIFSILAKNHALQNLVKSSSFFAPPPSSPALMVAQTSSSMTPSIPSTPPMHPPVNLQWPYGAPMLEPFPPPTPSPSLTPAPTPNYGPVISKDKVREALTRVLQVCLQSVLLYIRWLK